MDIVKIFAAPLCIMMTPLTLSVLLGREESVFALARLSDLRHQVAAQKQSNGVEGIWCPLSVSVLCAHNNHGSWTSALQSVAEPSESKEHRKERVTQETVDAACLQYELSERVFTTLQQRYQERWCSDVFNWLTPLGWTPLTLAVTHNYNEMVTSLMKAGADPNTPDAQGWTPLCIAVKAKRLIMVELLLESRADANIQSPEGWTPLLLCCKRNDSSTSSLLLRGGPT